jgi:hypothetical protein
MTRFESAPLSCPSQSKTNPSDQPSHPSVESVRVSTLQSPKAGKITFPSDRHQANDVMTRFESDPFHRPSRPKTCPSDRHQATDLMTRFESAPFACPSRPKTCPSDRRQANVIMTRFESAHLACPSRQTTFPSDGLQANDVMTRFESARFVCQRPAENNVPPTRIKPTK